MTKQKNNRDLSIYRTITKKVVFYVIRVSERKEKGGAEKIFEEIITKKLPSLAEDKPKFRSQNSRTEQTPNR